MDIVLHEVPHKRRKLVVVEDDPDTREIELLLLTAEGYDVLALPDGERASEIIEREAVDLVILDLMLPGKDGLVVLRELASRPRTATTPVIVVSAYVQISGSREVLEQSPQVKQIIDKPFDVNVLLGAIAHELALTMSMPTSTG